MQAQASLHRSILRYAWRTALVVCVAIVWGNAGAAQPSPARTTPHAEIIARSSLVTLTATPTAHGTLALRVTRNANGSPIVGVGNLTLKVDGRSATVSAMPDGVYLLTARDLAGGAHTLVVVVSHDGIHELLTGTVTVPDRRSALDTLQDHGMFAWWVLNLAVILIAVVFISRRRKKK